MARRTTTPVKETAAGGEGPTLDVWIGQYNKNWSSIITPESFSHPAKFARGLLETIVEHALVEGWVKPGDHCLDPFGGIATGAYVCMSKGLRWTGVELEEHFHNLGQGCDCTGISKPDYARLYGRWPRMRYAHGHYLCPRCLAQVAQVTGERRPAQRIVRTHARAGCDEVWAAARTRKPYADVRPGPQPNTVEKTFTFLPLPFPDRRDGYGPPLRVQALFAAETASYARSSGVIPSTAPHHYVGNIEAWAAKGYTGATLLKGDSRHLYALIEAHADLLVSSSPYTGSQQVDNRTQLASAMSSTWRKRFGSITDGTDSSQLANLPPGSLDTALAPGAESPPQLDLLVSSSPYAASVHSPNSGPIDFSKVKPHAGGGMPSTHATPGCQGWAPLLYGTTDGQLGAMPPGSVAAVVHGELCASSPPYEASWHDPASGNFAERCRKAGVPEAQLQRYGNGHGMNLNGQAYGVSPEQLGTIQGATFWEAAKAVVSQTFQVLKPGAHAIWVTKMYIRDGKLVDFPGDWEKLCRACGFQTVHIHLAMLVERRVETHLFEGSVTYEQWKESFFRRLGRKKTGLGIEFETVICQVKPLHPLPMPPDEAWEQLPLVEVGAGADCSVSSPAYGNSVNAQSHGIDWRKAGPATGNRRRGGGSQHEATLRAQLAYGTNPDNLGCMPVGSLDCAISSSPYAATPIAACEGNMGGKAGGRKASALTTVSGNIKVLGYSTNPDNLGNMPEGPTP